MLKTPPTHPPPPWLAGEAESGPGWFPTLQRTFPCPKVYEQHKRNSIGYQFLIERTQVGWGRKLRMELGVVGEEGKGSEPDQNTL